MTEVKKEQTTTHKIGIYLWIWGLLFVLSFFSYGCGKKADPIAPSKKIISSKN